MMVETAIPESSRENDLLDAYFPRGSHPSIIQPENCHFVKETATSYEVGQTNRETGSHLPRNVNVYIMSEYSL